MSSEPDRSFEELRPHALALLDAAAAEGMALSLMGGIGIRLRSPDLGGLDPASRPYHDIDLVGRLRDVRAADRLIRDLGYLPDRAVNTQFGTVRRVYRHSAGFHVDLFFERLDFCHTIDLDGRLRPGAPTLPPADLLLGKLQIVQRNHKDLFDLYLLLLNHEVRDGQPEAIEASRLTALLADDWGFTTTALEFLADARARLPGEGLEAGPADRIAGGIDRLERIIAEAPKTLRWRTRARLGRRVPWYRNVEELL
jgi:hypothetical protein